MDPHEEVEKSRARVNEIDWVKSPNLVPPPPPPTPSAFTPPPPPSQSPSPPLKEGKPKGGGYVFQYNMSKGVNDHLEICKVEILVVVGWELLVSWLGAILSATAMQLIPGATCLGNQLYFWVEVCWINGFPSSHLV